MGSGAKVRSSGAKGGSVTPTWGDAHGMGGRGGEPPCVQEGRGWGRSPWHLRAQPGPSWNPSIPHQQPATVTPPSRSNSPPTPVTLHPALRPQDGNLGPTALLNAAQRLPAARV